MDYDLYKCSNVDNVGRTGPFYPENFFNDSNICVSIFHTHTQTLTNNHSMLFPSNGNKYDKKNQNYPQ